MVATRGVSDLRKNNPDFDRFCVESVFRYAVADWGDSPEDDRLQNDEAVRLDEDDKVSKRIVAEYRRDGLPTIWIITEWDRSYTTVLFPDEY